MEAEDKNKIQRLHAIIENLNDRIVRGQMKEEKILNEFSSTNNELVTLQRQLAKSNVELEKAMREAQRANDSKSRFLAMISHEFRTPMNGILGMTELLRQSPLAYEQRGWTELIEESASELLGMVNDLLDLSKSDAGALTIEEKPFDLRLVVEHVVQLLQPKAQAKRNIVSAEFEPSTAGILKGDPTRIRQILINLINNANTFTENGMIQVAVYPLPGYRGRIRFEIRDSGIGISQKNIDTLFRPYAQIDSGEANEGTGLGLMICKSLVKSMKGEIGVFSREEAGSTFWFELDLPEVDEPRKSGAALYAVSDNVPIASNLSVLVAEDNAVNGRVIRMQLKKLGVNSVEVAENGQAAVDAFRSGSYALILMDKQMPVMDGTEAARAIREIEQNEMRKPVPIVALTGEATESEREACFAAGMNDFLSKPINMDTLKAVLQKWVSKRSGQALDPDVIRELIELDEGDDPEIFRSLLEVYEEETPAKLSKLEELVCEGNLEQAMRTAHSLKSGSLSLGVHYFSELLEQIEYRLKEGQTEQVKDMLPGLNGAYEAACAELHRFA
ncbi:ATP-binding protein [Saccharibacillus sacchari]|uniref:ATP-binding protein n=1 Tax=Saccharibacillus sacchari TaxID=456493 RepID=A0ACC6P6C9_9BACL